MKKIISLILVFVMVFGLAACGSKQEAEVPAAPEAPAETEAPAEEKGCGSVIGSAAVVLAAVLTLGTGVALKKKED